MIEKITVLDRRREYLAGTGFTPPDVVTFLNQKVRQILIEDDNIIFENYEKVQNIEKVKKFYKNTFILAKAYMSNGTEYYSDMDILKLIEERLKYGNEYFYNKESGNYGDIYGTEIEIPLMITDILILTENKIKEKVLKPVLETLEYFQPDPRYSAHHSSEFGFSKGADLAEAIKVFFLKGVISEDEEKIILALNTLSDVWEYKDDSFSTDRDGFYRDGSFISRSAADAGNEGEKIIHNAAEIFYLVKGTKYEKYIKGLTNFYEILFKSFEPFFFNGSFSDVAVSRKFSSYETGHRILNSMLLAGLSASKEYQEKIWKTVKREIEKNKFYKYFENEKSPFFRSKMNELLSRDLETEEYKDQVIVFNNMDRVIKRNKNYSVGISMHSSKTGNYENVNGYNGKNWFTGDGAYFLYDEDYEQYENYWENIDPYYIPGTTEIKMDMENVDAERNFRTKFTERNMAGALKWHYYGAAGMDFVNWNEKLTSRKSWFFVSWGVIFAESNITGEGEVYTTILNRKFKDIPLIKADNTEITEKETKVKLENLEIDGRTYIFYGRTEINIKIEKRGKYYFVKVWKEHGENPVNSSLVWAVVMKNNAVISDLREKFTVTITEDKHILKGEKCNYAVNWKAEEETQPFCVIYRKDDNRESRMYIKNY
ncbi:MAG: polysaccharide lyase family 8 super-sandwich domain-containing protein [Fusobacterium sp.]